MFALRPSFILLARKARITPRDFDIVIDSAIAAVYPPETSKAGSKIRREREVAVPRQFEGHDEPLVNMNSKSMKRDERIIVTQAEEPKIVKSEMQQREVKSMIRELINSGSKMSKPNMDELYDARHEFEPSSETKEEDTDWFEDKSFNAPRWTEGANNIALRSNVKEIKEKGAVLELQEIIDELNDHAAINMKVIDTTAKVDHMDAVIICEGRSTRHVYSLADSIRILVLLELT